MNRTTFLVAIGGLLVGWFLGFVGPHPLDEPVAPVSPAKTPFPSGSDPGGGLQREFDQATSENAELQDQLRAADAKLTAETPSESAFPVPRKLISSLRFQVLDPDHKVSKELIEFLHLSDPEISAINASIRSATDQLNELQTEHESLVSQTPTQTKVDIAPFEQEGKAVHAQLVAQAQGALGADRAGVFMDLMDTNGYNDFANAFGENEMQVTITSQPGGNYQISTEYDMRMTGGRSTMMTTSQGIPPEYAHLFDTAPQDNAANPAPTSQ